MAELAVVDGPRSLMVMSSSTVAENSSTGPGTDPDQPNSPNGSAGSAFGHALWKALIGYSDGALDGVKDGFLSLGEIREFTITKTKQVGGHTPDYTGVRLQRQSDHESGTAERLAGAARGRNRRALRRSNYAEDPRARSGSGGYILIQPFEMSRRTFWGGWRTAIPLQFG